MSMEEGTGEGKQTVYKTLRSGEVGHEVYRSLLHVGYRVGPAVTHRPRTDLDVSDEGIRFFSRQRLRTTLRQLLAVRQTSSNGLDDSGCWQRNLSCRRSNVSQGRALVWLRHLRQYRQAFAHTCRAGGSLQSWPRMPSSW